MAVLLEFNNAVELTACDLQASTQLTDVRVFC